MNLFYKLYSAEFEYLGKSLENTCTLKKYRVDCFVNKMSLPAQVLHVMKNLRMQKKNIA